MVVVDSPPQPCPRCLRPTVLASYRTHRQWVHTSNCKPQCEAPTALVASPPLLTSAPALAAA